MTTNKYPPLPFPPTIEENETRQHFGLRLLRFVIEFKVTATMNDGELELAAYVVPLAMDGHGHKGTDLMVVEQVREASLLVTETLAIRQKAMAKSMKLVEQMSVPDQRGGAMPPFQAEKVEDPEKEWSNEYYLQQMLEFKRKLDAQRGRDIAF